LFQKLRDRFLNGRKGQKAGERRRVGGCLFGRQKTIQPFRDLLRVCFQGLIQDRPAFGSLQHGGEALEGLVGVYGLIGPGGRDLLRNRLHFGPVEHFLEGGAGRGLRQERDCRRKRFGLTLKQGPGRLSHFRLGQKLDRHFLKRGVLEKLDQPRLDLRGGEEFLNLRAQNGVCQYGADGGLTGLRGRRPGGRLQL